MQRRRRDSASSSQEDRIQNRRSARTSSNRGESADVQRKSARGNSSKSTKQNVNNNNSKDSEELFGSVKSDGVKSVQRFAKCNLTYASNNEKDYIAFVCSSIREAMLEPIVVEEDVTTGIDVTQEIVKARDAISRRSLPDDYVEGLIPQGTQLAGNTDSNTEKVRIDIL